MIRHPNFQITRPILEDDLLRMIGDGSLGAQDEICPSGGYWFTLQEMTEVKKYFGDLDLRKVFPVRQGEVTSSTDTHPLPRTKLIQPLPEPAARVVPAPHAPFAEKEDEKVPLKNIVAVVFWFLFFILILVWIWSGSY